MKQENINIFYDTFEAIAELSDVEKQLCQRAEEALQFSYSPYSKFRVGTAVLLDNGKLVSGSNQENAAYPSGLCAERVALFHIGATYPNAIIEAMAITAHTDQFSLTQPVTSCGACLQVMAEYEKRQGKPITVLFYCLGGRIIKVKGIHQLLPFAFVENRLGA